AGVHNKPNLWYVYSPTREIWDLYRYTRKHTVPLLQKPIFDLWVFYRRLINRADAKKIDKIVSISKNVGKRVKKYLKRDSKIIYPPIQFKKYQNKESKNYWLSVNRLITHKRIDLQFKAFEKLPDEKLIVVGSYENSKHFARHAEYIKSIKPKNVEIISWVSDQQLIDLYAECKGFITTAKDEDFGLTPLEAMASGKPVIAPNEGGYKETIVDGVTGKLIDDINPEKLATTIKEIGKNTSQYTDAYLRHAKKFDVEIFIQKIKDEIR
ncbi:glycosyltransferase, partial [bacterium]|nr:glycosyltransferase [bacterium]